MPIHIRVVRDDGDLAAIRSLWREMLERPLPGDTGSSEEGATAHLLVTDGDRPVGALRVTRGCLGTEASLGPLLPLVGDPARVATIDHIVLLPRYRGRFGLFFAAMKVALQVVKLWACDHLVVVAPSGMEREVERIGLSRLRPGAGSVGEKGETVMYAPVSALRSPFLTDLEGPMVEALGPFFHRAIYIQGDEVFREGERGDAAYVVARGSVCLTASRTVGEEDRREEVVVDLLGPGELFGELALLDGAPRMATVRAYASETDLSIIDGRHFNEAIDQDPARVRAVLRLLARRLRKSTWRAVSLMPPGAGSAMVQVMLDVARSSRLGRGGLIPGLTPEWLAGQVGHLPDTILELSAVLERRGLITWQLEGLWIHDVDELEAAFTGKPVSRHRPGRTRARRLESSPEWRGGLMAKKTKA